MRKRKYWVCGASILTAVLWFAQFPPFSFAEAAYFFLLPALFVLHRLDKGRQVFLFGWSTGLLFWISSLFWLRHVTWLGTILLSAVLALFFACWILLTWASYRRLRSSWLIPFALAAAWVVLEWVRSWLFWGFPWSPVSASQWNRPAVLPIISITGSWGLSFLLVWINLLMYEWFRKPFTTWKQRGFLPVMRGIPLPLVVAIGVLMSGSIWYYYHSRDIVPSEPVRIGFVQPYTELKWSEEAYRENLEALWKLTRAAAADGAELILWPESATPYPIVGNEWMRAAIEALSEEIDTPLLIGNMAYHREEQYYENGIFYVDPGTGLASAYYAKRKLVPFGEFIPFRSLFPFLDKFVPIPLDCHSGEGALTFPLGTKDASRIGTLVCYEDIFPALSRDTVQLGADWLFVATNNTWYGEEAGAHQHAMHSILRAAEFRRPVLRSGNGGWSGWIDEWGRVRYNFLDERGSIYHQGQSVVSVSRDLRFGGYLTVYAKYGNWFVYLCLALTLFHLAKIFSSRNQSPV